MPTQQITAASQIKPTPRETLQGNRNYYVRTDGSDLNNGLTNSASGAFRTIMHAVSVATALDLSIYSVVINIGAGNWNESISLTSYVGTGPIQLVGDNSTPSNVILQDVTLQRFAGRWDLAGFRFCGLVLAYPGSFLVFSGKLEFANINGHHIQAYGGLIQLVPTSYSIVTGTGPFCAHMLASNGGYILANGSYTVFIYNNPTMQWSFAFADFEGRIEAGGVYYTGSCVGTRYVVTYNAVIQTYGGGPNYFPGTIPGSTSSGGQYN